jgi:hypothetical protein
MVRLSDGVTVAQGPLEAFVMVRIHVGQPIFTTETANLIVGDTETTRKTPDSETGTMRFPKRIYTEAKCCPACQLAWHATGKRRMERFEI